MQHFFILGNTPALSAAEILAVTGLPETAVRFASPEVLVLESEAIDYPKLMGSLGGTVKMGAILEELTGADHKFLSETIAKAAKAAQVADKRLSFGLSLYRLAEGSKMSLAEPLDAIGMGAKKCLGDEDIACRWVKPSEGTSLSSAAVLKNKLLQEGAEFVLLEKSGTLLLGKTEAIQPLEQFSDADFGRPGRDTRQGMLPPKLASMMINIAMPKNDGALLDPFCGSGTILTEALQLGVKKVFGSDKNPAAIADTEKNIAWCKEKGLIPADASATVWIGDARSTHEKLPASSIDAIASEPFLGPPRNGREQRGELQRMLLQLGNLYYESLSSWKKFIKTGATIVLALPVYRFGEESHCIEGRRFLDLGYAFEPSISPSLTGRLGSKPGKNGGIIYGRPNQHVWREIVKMKRTNE